MLTPIVSNNILFFCGDFLFFTVHQSFDVVLVLNGGKNTDNKRSESGNNNVPQAGLGQQVVKHEGNEKGIGRIEQCAGDARTRNNFSEDKNNKEGGEND